MDQEKVGKKIKEIRQKQNLSQQKFAELYGVTYQAVSKWENGKNMPDITILKQICEDNNIDINTMMKMKSIMEKMNSHSNDPRTNLLQSLKPYLRDEKKDKLDQYSKLLNMTALMELFNQNDHKENSSDKS